VHPVYLDGPSVCGFWGMFDSDFGDPNTNLPLCRITPTKVGSALLPFRCPRCDSAIDFSDSKRLEHYHDTRLTSNGKKRDNYWCPTCGNRFLINFVGRPLEGKLDSSGVAPSTVECITVGSDGLVNLQRSVQGVTTILGLLGDYIKGCDVLGCL